VRKQTYLVPISQEVSDMKRDEENKKMTLKDVLEYATSRGMNSDALAKLEETYKELLKEEK
jgi:hypothetical protein